MFQERTIRDFNQRTFSFEEFIRIIQEFDEKGYDFYVGTDSQIVKKKVSIVTCICVIPAEGFVFGDENAQNKIFYVKDKLKKKDLREQLNIDLGDKSYPSIRMRMLLEAYRSIEAAMEVEGYIDNLITVHLDVGDDETKPPGSRSSATTAYQKELRFLVEGQGYLCDIKPDAWAASAVADRMAKS